MRLYWIKAQAPRRVLALAKYLGLDIEYLEKDLRGGELHCADYAALNPNMKAPTLVDGDLVVWEASAIMAHLCIRAGSDLWPSRRPGEQVEVLRWLSWCDHHWSPALGPYYFEYVVKPTFGFGQPDPGALLAKEEPLRKHAGVLDSKLENHDYVTCNRLTIADFQLASMATHWHESNMPLEDYANIVAWIDRLMEIPAWANPWPIDDGARSS
jgi:glutathione S-transferase